MTTRASSGRVACGTRGTTPSAGSSWSRAARAAATPPAPSSGRSSACGARTRTASRTTASGTIDIFNIDSVDFFYNQTAPLTQYFWGTETLRRITRIIRMTQPDVYIGFTPSLAAGHGNHQMAGRYIWEGMKAAADPAMFPEQLTGPNALSHVAGQEGLLGRLDDRDRRHDDGRRLHHRLPPRHRDGHQPRQRGGRLDGLRLSLQLAGRQSAGPDRRQDVGAGRLRGRVGLSDAEPHDVQGGRQRPDARASA